MEPIVIKMVKAEWPIKIVKTSSARTPNRYIDQRLPFLAAEIDFEWEPTKAMLDAFPEVKTTGNRGNGEVKTVHPFGAGVYGEAGTDEIPVQYACQAMHGLGVTDRETTLVPLLVGSDNLRLYHVNRNEELIAEMRKRCEFFWHTYVLPKVPPPPTTIGDVHKLLKVRNDVRVQADEEMLELVSKLVDASEAKSKAEKAAEFAQFDVIRKLVGPKAQEEKTMEGRHIIVRGNQELVTVTLQGRENVSAKDLKVAHPDIYAQFAKLSTFFVCRTKKAK